MPLVGTLTVDLVANTAQFTGDLGRAGDNLEQLGKKGKQAGDDLDFSMTESRGSMMLLSEELGVHIPRHLQALIAQIPLVGVAFAEMLPIVGVIAAIAIIEKLVAANEEAKEKLAQGWDKFGVTSIDVMNGLDDKMLQVGKRADELAGNHLAALREELLLIDRASMREVVAEFGKLSGAADAVFTELKTHWYSMEVGSEGAKHALDSFKSKYDLLIATGKNKDASDLLKGTLDSAEASLKAMQSAGFVARGLGEVSKEGVQAQHALIDTLKEQVRVEEQLAAINGGEKQNATTEERIKATEREAEAFKKSSAIMHEGMEERKRDAIEAAKSQEQLNDIIESLDRAVYKAKEKSAEEWLKTAAKLNDEERKQATVMAKLQESAEEQEAKHKLAMHQANAQQTTDAEIEAVNKRAQIDTQAQDRAIASLDKHDAMYLVKLQEFENKKKQIEQQSAIEIAKITETAEEKKYQDIARAEGRMEQAIASTAAKSIVEGKSMGEAFKQLGKQMLETAISDAFQMETLEERKRLGYAKTAAASAFSSVMEHVPEPLSAVLAPIAAGVAFAGVMAFEEGGKIPGSGPRHIVGHGGETVVTKALTDRVEAAERGRNRGGGNTTIMHIHVKDADGFKHSQSQIIAKQQHAAELASRRNR